MSQRVTLRQLFSAGRAIFFGCAATVAMLLPCCAWAQAPSDPGALPTAPPASTAPDVPPLPPEIGRAGDFETGTFSEFNGSPSILHGTLVPVQGNAYSGDWSAQGSYDGSGANGFARVMWDVEYESGDTIRYGASYYLSGPLPCWAMLARWDNYALYGRAGDVGGVELEDGVIRLIRGNYDGSNYARLSPNASVPLGRWFSIEVIQRLGAEGATNELYLDGTLVGGSTTPNSRGRSIRHIRFGYVAVAAPCTPASAFFIDRVFAS
jgi:hypothetical protein